jgi:hypothetical protein
VIPRPSTAASATARQSALHVVDEDAAADDPVPAVDPRDIALLQLGRGIRRPVVAVKSRALALDDIDHVTERLRPGGVTQDLHVRADQ